VTLEQNGTTTAVFSLSAGGTGLTLEDRPDGVHLIGTIGPGKIANLVLLKKVPVRKRGSVRHHCHHLGSWKTGFAGHLAADSNK
jgi:hypothetical protein